MRASRFLFTMAAVAACSMSADAQPVLDVPFAETTPRVDASLDDPAWRGAAVIPTLTLSIKPGGETRVMLPTRVCMVWDEQFLYVRFACADAEIYAPFTRHDETLYLGDVVEVFLDAKGDGRRVVELEVSPDNVTFDKLLLVTTEPRSDAQGKLLDEVLAHDFVENLEWTLPGWRTAARRSGDAGPKGTPGWMVDLAIPAEPLLRELALKKFEPLTLRANLLRYDWPLPKNPAHSRTLVACNWAPVLDGCPHISPAAMGTLRLCPRRGSFAPTR